jgi:uncharacterized repeat protein (TIGR03803 family)
VFDTAGNLYGTTGYDGSAGQGTVFRPSPNPDGTWTETILYAFQGCSDGDSPGDRVILDASGNVYGITEGGGSYGLGVVFELSPTGGGQWTEAVLHAFTGGTDGEFPRGKVVVDSAGNVYGVTSFGGSYGFDPGGVAFEISR